MRIIYCLKSMTSESLVQDQSGWAPHSSAPHRPHHYMASPTSSCAPSSSAVIIPTPGKSILKRPPPTQQSFFSRISKFLPTQTQPQVTTGDETRTLRRAHFILPELVTVYPISAANPPSTPTLKEEKRSIEQREAERRRRVVRGDS